MTDELSALLDFVQTIEDNSAKRQAMPWETRYALEREYRSLYWELNEMQIVAHDPVIVNSNTCSKYYMQNKIDKLQNRIAAIIDELGYTPEA